MHINPEILVDQRGGEGARTTPEAAVRLLLDWLEPKNGSELAACFSLDERVVLPVVDYAPTWEGRHVTSRRLLDFDRGTRLRREALTVEHDTPTSWRVTIDQRDDDLQLAIRTRLHLAVVETGVVVTGGSTLQNSNPQELRLSFVTSLILPAPIDIRDGSAHILRSRNAWLAEHRWVAEPLTDALPFVNPAAHHMQQSRGSVRDASTGTWTSGAAQPTAFLTARSGALGWEWYGEGQWTWEVGESHDVPWVALTGPTEQDHLSPIVLAPGESYDTGEAVAALSTIGGIEAVVAALAEQRRARRIPHPDHTTPALVYNDYLNTVGGDPDEQTSMLLMQAAAEAGVEYFCIDAGWYDDARDGWWDAIGEWRMAPSRFPGGIANLVNEATSRQLNLGLWVEPCSIGVRSALVATAPDGALFRREGVPFRQAGRHYLDFSSTWVQDHLSETIAGLVAEGVRYFKFDDNVEPASGDDSDGDLPGRSLEAHARGYRQWTEALRRRHPEVVFETCASGGMKTTPAQLEVFQLASLSDQQDFRLMPPIVVNAMMTLPVEQTGVWASVQREMTVSEATFALATGITGRLYLSGWLDRIDDDLKRLVHDAAAVFRTVREATPVPLRSGRWGWQAGPTRGWRSGTRCRTAMESSPSGRATHRRTSSVWTSRAGSGLVPSSNRSSRSAPRTTGVTRSGPAASASR